MSFLYAVLNWIPLRRPALRNMRDDRAEFPGGTPFNAVDEFQIDLHLVSDTTLQFLHDSLRGCRHKLFSLNHFDDDARGTHLNNLCLLNAPGPFENGIEAPNPSPVNGHNRIIKSAENGLKNRKVPAT
jgi:hypothetical protein